jgi:hypothetical protein
MATIAGVRCYERRGVARTTMRVIGRSRTNAHAFIGRQYDDRSDSVHEEYRVRAVVDDMALVEFPLRLRVYAIDENGTTRAITAWEWVPVSVLGEWT